MNTFFGAGLLTLGLMATMPLSAPHDAVLADVVHLPPSSPQLLVHSAPDAAAPANVRMAAEGSGNLFNRGNQRSTQVAAEGSGNLFNQGNRASVQVAAEGSGNMFNHGNQVATA